MPRGKAIKAKRGGRRTKTAATEVEQQESKFEPLSLSSPMYKAIFNSLTHEIEILNKMRDLVRLRASILKTEGKPSGLYGQVEGTLIDMSLELPKACESIRTLGKYAESIENAVQENRE